MRTVDLFARVGGRWRRILSGRKGLLFLLAACLFLVLFFGLKSVAKDSEDSFFSQDSGALDYLEISAPGAENLEYVILNQVAGLCGAPAFSSGADIRSALQRIEASVVEEAQTLALCIRADYGSSHYVYRKYMEDKGFLVTPVPDENSLQVVFLHHEIQQIHYVVLEEWGMQCNPDVFGGSAGYEVKALGVDLYDGGGKPKMRTATVELVGERQSLCFRASYSNGNFTYDQYGGAKIELHIDSEQDGADDGEDGIVSTEYLVFSAVHAVNMQAVELQSLGEPCSVEAFQPDRQVYATSYDELSISRELSAAQEAICLRVDYGGGHSIYKKYPEDVVVVTPRYKLSLTLKREGNTLTVSSNTDVERWRLFRDYPYLVSEPNDDWSWARLGNRLVSRCAFAAQSDEPEVRDIIGRFERQPANKSSDPQKGFVFDLIPEDYGEAYCVEAVDGDGNRGYLVTNVLQSNLNITITQDGDVLSAVVDKPELVNSWQAIRITDIKECSDYSFIHRPIHADQSSLALTAADDDRFYCFKVNDIYGGHKVAVSGRILMENLGVADLKQLGGQLFVQANQLDTGYVRPVQGRFVRVSADSACNSVILDDAEAVQSLSWYYIFELIPLTATDVGYSYCVEMTFANGFTSHKLSVPISPFQVSSSDAAEDFQNLVNLVLLSSFSIDDIDLDDSEDVDSDLRRPDTVAQISAYTEQHGVEISILRDVLIDVLAGSGYFGVDDLNDFIEFGRSPNDASDFKLVYDFEVPDDLSPQAFADSLRPHLNVIGRQILDNTKVVFDLSIREYAAGTYTPDSRLISLAIDDDEIDYYSQTDELEKQQIFGRQMEVFIHEFVHATDYQDDAINASEFEKLEDGDYGDFFDKGLGNLVWSCLGEQAAYPPGIFSLVSNIPEGDGVFEDFISLDSLYWNSSDAGLKDYYDCLDRKQPLMAALRSLHDSPPADYRAGPGERYLIRQGYLVNVAVRWGRDSHLKNSPNWYTEFYAEAVFVKDLPNRLEAHYSRYFIDRQEVIRLYEAGRW